MSRLARRSLVVLSMCCWLAGCPRFENDDRAPAIANASASFTASRENGASLRYRFRNRSLLTDATNVVYRWDFGDESPVSLEFEPQHAFPAPGRYAVTLEVSADPKLFDRYTREVEVVAYDVRVPPIAPTRSLVTRMPRITRDRAAPRP